MGGGGKLAFQIFEGLVVWAGTIYSLRWGAGGGPPPPNGGPPPNGHEESYLHEEAPAWIKALERSGVDFEYSSS